jgi:hypothetical protein
VALTGMKNSLRIDCGGAWEHSMLMTPNNIIQIPEAGRKSSDSLPVVALSRKAMKIYIIFVRIPMVKIRQKNAVEPILSSRRRPFSVKLKYAKTRERNLLHRNGLKMIR